MSRRALICGVLGQDGSYLAERLTALGYMVIGTVRDTSQANGTLASSPGTRCSTSGIIVTASMSVDDWRLVLREHQPEEIYNFAGRTSGREMYEDAVGMGEANGQSVVRLLEAIRLESPNARFCQASSSEMYGEPVDSPQNEDTPLAPVSPYGAAKAYAHHMVGIYRRHYGLHACSAILFNHESPRRSERFVTRKVTLAAARIALGLDTTVRLGNLSAARDWGYAPDFVEGMRLMLAHDEARDHVLATGRLHTVAELCEAAFAHAGLDYRDHVRTDDAVCNEPEKRRLVGDATRARTLLQWGPSIGFKEMISAMVEHDRHLLNTAQTARAGR